MSVEDAKLLTDAIVWTDGAQYFDVESGFQIVDDGIAVYVNGVMLAKDKFIFDSNSRRVEFTGGYSPVAGDHIQVGRDIVPAQENTLSAYSGYNRELFEKMFDKLTLMCVEFKEKLNRALMVNTIAEDGKAAEMVETLSRLPQEISQIQSDLDNLFEDMNANEVEFASLHTAVNSVRDSLANVVTLLDNKAAKNHVHTSADITGLDDAFNTLESTLAALTNTVNGKADAKHTHTIDDVADLRNELDNKFVLPSGGNNGQVLAKDASGAVVWTTVESTGGSGGGSDITVDSALSDTSVNPVQNKIVTQSVKQLETNISNLNTALNGKAPSSHTHLTSDISGFDTAISNAIAGKANQGDVISLNTSLSSHTANSTIHVTLDEKNTWNNKANAGDLTALADRVTALEGAGGESGGSSSGQALRLTSSSLTNGCAQVYNLTSGDPSSTPTAGSNSLLFTGVTDSSWTIVVEYEAEFSSIGFFVKQNGNNRYNTGVRDYQWQNLADTVAQIQGWSDASEGLPVDITLTIEESGSGGSSGGGEVEMPHVVEAYRWRYNDDGGTSTNNYVAAKWYRKWSDGYVEQGGELYSGSSSAPTPNALYENTLPVPLAKQPLNVSVSDTSGNGAKVQSFSKTSISISVTKNTSKPIFWEVKGYYK